MIYISIIPNKAPFFLLRYMRSNSKYSFYNLTSVHDKIILKMHM